MTQENKKLLLQDLCARLPYGVYIQHITGIQGKLNNINLLHFYNNTDSVQDVTGITKFFGEDYVNITTLKPYLRPMSSMTKEEKREFQSFYPGCFGSQWLDVEKGEIEIFECSSTIKLYLNNNVEIVDWLNAHHFDYRGLIEKGLALEAQEGMYEIQN